MMSNKVSLFKSLTKGVEFCLKKIRSTYLKGKGVLFSPNDVVVYEKVIKNRIKQKTLLIATGSDVALSLPGVDIDEKIFFINWSIIV